MKNRFSKTIVLMLSAVYLVSCTKDLNREPINTTTDNTALSTALGYKQALAKVYAAFALTGSTGSGSSDLGGIDAGTSDFLRLYWNAQELPTDEAVCVWGDPGVPDFHNNNWTSSNVLLNGLYNRSIYQIVAANAFIAEATDDKLSSRGITGADLTNVKYFRAEARFLRAYQYWVLMDMFGNPPFVDENSPIGKTLPPQITRAKLFAYIESELKAIDPLLVAPRQNEYGRVDQAADWALQARMFLNAEVYLGAGNGRYNDAVSYSAKVINAGFTLMPKYKNLFLADNNLNNPEIILPIQYDGVQTQNYGGTTFIINSSINNSTMNPALYGVPSGGWGGNHTTQVLPNLFGDYSGNTDTRAIFFTTGATLNTTDLTTFTSGFAVVKFSNVTSTGATAPSAGGTYTSTDFPLFRLAEMYLTYSEAVLRGGTGGSSGTALQYFNALRTRAYGNTNGNVGSIALADIINEKAREMYWEATRRTDLIRFGMFTGGTYLWPFKGGVLAGVSIPAFRSVYPLPSTDVTANPNLIQNTGY
jgi:hypothetical protein